MALDLSIAQMLAELESKVAHHRDQTAVHAVALDTALAHLDALKTASLSAGELLEQHEALEKPAGAESGHRGWIDSPQAWPRQLAIPPSRAT